MGYAIKHLRLLKRAIIINFMRFNEYKANYYLRIGSFLTMTVVTILFWNIILLQTESIKGWEIYSLTLLVVFGRFQGAIFYGLFGGLKRLAEYVVDGEINNYLTKPASVLFRIMFNEIHILGLLDFIVGIVLSLGVILYFTGDLAILQFMLALMVLIIGNIIVELVFGCVSVLSFWFGRMDLMVSQMESLLDYSRYPLSIFPQPIELFFTFIVPFIFVRTYPVMIYTGTFDINILQILGLELFVLIFWTLLFVVLWKRGIKRFESFGG